MRVATTPPGLPAGIGDGHRRRCSARRRRARWAAAGSTPPPTASAVPDGAGAVARRPRCYAQRPPRVDPRRRATCARTWAAARTRSPATGIVLLAAERPGRPPAASGCTCASGPPAARRRRAPCRRRPRWSCARGAAAGCGAAARARAVVVPAGRDRRRRHRPARQGARGGRARWPPARERVVVHVGGARRGGPPARPRRRRRRARAHGRASCSRRCATRSRAGGGRSPSAPTTAPTRATGAHDAAPVPAVVWGAGVGARRAGPADRARRGRRAGRGRRPAARPLALEAGVTARVVIAGTSSGAGQDVGDVRR